MLSNCRLPIISNKLANTLSKYQIVWPHNVSWMTIGKGTMPISCCLWSMWRLHLSLPSKTWCPNLQAILLYQNDIILKLQNYIFLCGEHCLQNPNYTVFTSSTPNMEALWKVVSVNNYGKYCFRNNNGFLVSSDGRKWWIVVIFLWMKIQFMWIAWISNKIVICFSLLHVFKFYIHCTDFIIGSRQNILWA